MKCPTCGKQLNSKYRFCPTCLSKSLGIKDLKTKNNNNARNTEYKNGVYSHKKFTKDTNKKKGNVDPSNVNGYVVGEGMSIKGGKLRKGADSSRHAQHRRWRYGY